MSSFNRNEFVHFSKRALAHDTILKWQLLMKSSKALVWHFSKYSRCRCGKCRWRSSGWHLQSRYRRLNICCSTWKSQNRSKWRQRIAWLYLCRTLCKGRWGLRMYSWTVDVREFEDTDAFLTDFVCNNALGPHEIKEIEGVEIRTVDKRGNGQEATQTHQTTVSIDSSKNWKVGPS